LAKTLDPEEALRELPMDRDTRFSVRLLVMNFLLGVIKGDAGRGEYRIPRPEAETEGDLPSVLTSVTSGGAGATLPRTFHVHVHSSLIPRIGSPR